MRSQSRLWVSIKLNYVGCIEGSTGTSKWTANKVQHAIKRY